MNPPILTFFNNKSGVGKTSLVYHLAWMFSTLGQCVIAVDLDPQANLTAAFLDEDKIDEILNNTSRGMTIFESIKPLMAVGDIINPVLQPIANNLYLLPGDIELSDYEDTLSDQWPRSMGESNLYRPMRTLTAFWQVMQIAAHQVNAHIILIDVGPHLGAINRSALIATDYVIVPLGADLFSLRGLEILGPKLREWRDSWKKRLDNWRENKESRRYPEMQLPQGKIESIGYLCQQHGVRLTRPVKAYDKWLNRIPKVYRTSVLNEESNANIQPTDDPYCLATVKHYRSLVPMAQEHRKPIFNLTPADGAIGSHANAAQDAKKDFKQLAEKIAHKIGISL